jgi:hypothetical protein
MKTDGTYSQKSYNPRSTRCRFTRSPVSGFNNCSVEEELAQIRRRLGPWTERLYYKRIDLKDFVAVKAVILGFEQPQLAGTWRSVGRWAKLLSC